MQMELGRETEWCWPSALSHRAVLDFAEAAVSGCLLFRPLLGLNSDVVDLVILRPPLVSPSSVAVAKGIPRPSERSRPISVHSGGGRGVQVLVRSSRKPAGARGQRAGVGRPLGTGKKRSSRGLNRGSSGSRHGFLSQINRDRRFKEPPRTFVHAIEISLPPAVANRQSANIVGE